MFVLDFDALGLESASLTLTLVELVVAPLDAVILVVCGLKELVGVTLGGGGRGGGADLVCRLVLPSGSSLFSFF